MNRRWNGLKGFTLVELIVVIAVIGILAAITIVGFSRYQADTRDARRVSSVTSISEALEKYYDENGEYPGCSTVTSSSATTALKGVNPSVLVAPQAGSGASNSLKCEPLSISGSDFFEYAGDGSPTCSSGASCLAYTLKYKEEATGTIKEQASRRQATIATSNVPVVTVGTIGADSVALSWTPAANASSYSIQRATNTGFTANLASSTATSTSTTVTGLNSSTTYYFRVAGVNNAVTGQWSNTVGATTLSIGAPTITGAVANAAGTQLNVQWTAGVNAITYTMQRAANSSFTSPTTTTGIATTSANSTGLTTGSLYYFRTQSVNGAATSSWSNTLAAGATTPPTNPAATAGACAAVNVSWTASPGATSYTIQASTQSDFSNAINSTGHTGTSGTASGLTGGTLNYIRVLAYVGSGVSAPSATVTATPGVCAPAPYTISAYDNGGTWTATSNAVCAAGTTPNYYWYANGGAWVNGDQYKTVGYSLGYGQGVTLTVNTRCYNSSGTSGWTGASNSAGYTRGVPAPYLNGLASGGGRRVNASWSAVCGGLNELLLRQGSYTDTSNNRFALPNNYGTTDTRVWNSSGVVRYNVRTNCNGIWSDWSNEQSRSV